MNDGLDVRLSRECLHTIIGFGIVRKLYNVMDDKILDHKYKSIIASLLTTILLPVSNIAFAQNLEAPKTEKIAIDAGFGGNDHGPVGCSGKAYAKDINLILAQKLKNRLKELIGVETVMIRDNDSFIPLEERTSIANMSNVDLLISLQTNGSPDTGAYGIETYYLNFVKDKASVIPEKATVDTRELQTILNDLMENSKTSESKRLAGEVHNSLIMHLSERYSHIKNRGIKQAPYVLLVGARMPAIMIQTSFITNQRECERLKSDDYQNDIVEGIAKGVQKFIKQEEKKNKK